MFDLLKGVRVIDLSTVVMGPYATQMLGDMGAEVIKVEPPEGDVFRAAWPVGPGGTGAGFLNVNRNKKSVALDLRQPEAHAQLLKLVESADVFVHNLRPQSAARLGVDFEAIRAARPDVVYCSASGYGEGPLRDEPAYDDCIQAISGLAWLNSADGETPRFLPSILCDKVAGLHLAFAISTALASRARTGQGVAIETPMYETMASFLLLEHLAGESFDPPRGPMGYNRLFSDNRRPYRTADGWIAVMPYNRTHWQSYLRIVGHEELIDDPRVTNARERAAHIDWLYSLVSEASAQRTTAAWLEVLRAADIPCAPVQRMEDLLMEPHLQQAGLFEMLDHPTEGRTRTVRSPFAMSRASAPDRPAPVLGADGADILAS